ncbi:hypothetical protein ACF0H5_023092 [Mactra antiquata]
MSPNTKADTGGDIDVDENTDLDAVPIIDDNDEDSKCGFGSYRPDCLQVFGRISMFIGVYSISGLLTSSLSVYVNSQVPMLEKEFGFSSADSGLIMSCNDIGFLTCVIFAGYIAKKVHIPIGLGISMILFGICGVLCALPYFIQDKSKYDLDQTSSGMVDMLSNITRSSMRSSSRKVPMCTNTTGSNIDSCDVTSDSAEARENVADLQLKNIAFYLIAIGMVFQGIGKSPRSPFVTLYVDDAVEKRKTGYYMGIVVGTGIFGPALAFILGGLFSKMYVTLEEVDITPSDPRWVGAWWLGFIIFGSSAIIFSVPLMCFPKKLKTPKRRKIDSMMLAKMGKLKEDDVTSMKLVHELKEFGLTVLRLIKNPVYMAFVLSNVINLLGVGAGVGFMAKYFAAQYSQPLWKANIILAISSISAVSVGAFLGGLITRKFKMTPQTTLKILVAFYLVSIASFVSGFFLGCDQPQVYGSNNIGVESSHYELIQPSCNQNCDCNEQKYFPICGDDGRSYFSPCHAGCTESGKRTFTNCTCIASGNAVAGLCDQGCSSNLYAYAALTFIGKLVTALKIMPTYIAQIRCVAESDRAAASAFSSFATSALAWMPGPVIMGALIDKTCTLWKYSCGERQSCSLYDSRDFRTYLHGFGTTCYSIACFIIILMYMYFRVTGKAEWRSQGQGQQGIEIIKVNATNGKENIYKPLNKKVQE